MESEPDVIAKVSLAAVVGVLIVYVALRSHSEPQQAQASAEPERRVLRVCADPNNLPFSNRRLEGFENRLAELIADEMDADLEYYWWAQHRGFIRNTLGQNRCDVILGTATGMDRILTTAPYYRSTFVFVSRSDRELRLTSFDSPLLRKLRIGVHLVGDDGANTPPVHALHRRNMAGNIVGFSLTGDYAQENPPAELLQAVVSGEVDTAVVWGPLAGYFARTQGLDLVPVSPAVDLPFLPMVYDISAGVRRGEMALQRELEGIFERRREDIERILEQWGIPTVGDDGSIKSGWRL